jgi:DNA-binding winged helix-turn-helix (wHTH) protein/pimeloyl-ACP methyl ester carboxylesterase
MPEPDTKDFDGRLIYPCGCLEESFTGWRSTLYFAFENQVLDVDRRELRRGSELIAIEPQVFDLLVYLLRNRDRVVSKDDLIAGVWGGRIVSESTLDSRINAVRKAIGDSGEQQRLVRTVARKGIRFVGDVREIATSEAKADHVPSQQHAIRFCTASDGVRIAYALAGHGPPLVKAGNWLNHLEYDWQSPIWSPLLHALAAEHLLIRYDARGNGLSDWDVDEVSFDGFLRDLESVVEAVRVERFALLGISQGCALSIAYAARYPERVSHLILYGGFARGRRKRGSQQEIDSSEAILTLMRQGWGQENPAFRQMFTSLFMPEGSAEQMQWFNDLQRNTTSPENAVRLRRAVDEVDVTDLLQHIKVPTLVLHCRNDAMQPFEEGRQVAAGIPGARFVALEGRNHMILEGDTAWDRFLDEVRSFLRT